MTTSSSCAGASAVLPADVEHARSAALEVLHHNAVGPHKRLFRTAGWGYPEPYTRDIMLSAPGICVSGDERLLDALRAVLEELARNQTPRGHIPSLAHDPENRGASDTTPLFLFGTAIYRRTTGERAYLQGAVERAMTWMGYQSPEDRIIVAQQPTTDWRDEQWVMGYGLYVNAVVYLYLRWFGRHDEASRLVRHLNRVDIHADHKPPHRREGLVVPMQPYYALWSFKLDHSERFDLLGNSLAVLAGIASPSRRLALIGWIEQRCAALREEGELAGHLPPCLFPYIRPEDPDWRPRYARFNPPASYHNGGVWPFIAALYVAALVAAGRRRLASTRLSDLAAAVQPARRPTLSYGFNEWLHAVTGEPRGQDWQTWSAALYVYACRCVETGTTPFFEEVRLASDRLPPG